MDYKKIYDNFILIKRQQRSGIVHKRGDNLCMHHIIPKCIGGPDTEENLVLLTYREHVFVHRLLTRIYPNEGGIALAITFMTRKSIITKGKVVNSKELDELDRLSREYKRQLATGKHPSEETRKKQRLAKIGTKASQKTRELLSKIRMGHPVSKETREKLSKSKMGYSPTEEHRKNVGLSKKGQKMSEKTREKISGGNAYTAKKIKGPTGKVYNTIREACSDAGCTESTLKSWIRNHPEKGYEFLNPDDAVGVRHKPIKGPDGKIYKSIHQAAKETKVSRHTIRKYIDLGIKFSYLDQN